MEKIKMTNTCDKNTVWQEKQIDNTVPDEVKSDSFEEGDAWGQARSIRDLMLSLGFTRQQWEALCTGKCTNDTKQCLPKEIVRTQTDNLIIQKITMDLPNGKKRTMYWALVSTRPGTMKIKATDCECVTVPYF
ncbi:hypothetical protein DKG77_14350 [Flagellimonas aquimarina]|uniref:Uncharacterized protein n=1 Tax=Flagellimonas aquimarina TaxID=2201895 RepID=A0A316KYN1_9FLAO|nr:hypothetical protein [Allomuricauda koreensis]PWL37935.1 hypothetical protein DKG77_14350 [Allomuricauda koreensis]